MTELRAKTESKPGAGESPLREALLVASVLGITLVTYLGTFWYGFVYDDNGQIAENSYIQYWRHVPLYFISHVWAYAFPRVAGNYYRPLFLLWLRLNDACFGLRPRGWHATSIALHLLATLLVYFTAKKLTQRISVATLTALVFGPHPMHAEVVAWVSGATESLCAVFVLAAFLAYLKSRESHAVIWMSMSCVLYVFAVLSKETGGILPLLVFAHCWIYAEGNLAAASNALRRFAVCVRTTLPYAPVALFYLAARDLVLHGLSHPVMPLTFRQVVFSIPSMAGFYVKKWFLPIRLDEFYDMPYWGTPNFWHVLLPAFLVIALCAAIWMARYALGAREVEFALFWIIVPLLPVLDARMLPPDELTHDRYYYLPSVGASLLVALLVDRLTRSPRLAENTPAKDRSETVFGFPAAQVVVAVVLAASLSALTVRESQFWASDFTLFGRAYVLAPLNPTVRLNYGMALISAGDYAGAQSLFTADLAQNPRDWDACLQLGKIAYREGNYADAQRWFRQANQLNQSLSEVYANLGLTDLRLNQLNGALDNMRTAVQLDPNDPNYRFAYGVVLEVDGNCIMADDQFRALLQIRPGEGYAELQLNRCQQFLSRSSRN